MKPADPARWLWDTVFRWFPHRTRPGLRRVGDPGPHAPVLVTGNYTLTVRRLARALEGRTAVVIAHRLTTVQRADEIVILEGGSVCERGPRQVLANDPASRFYGLLQTGLEEVLA